MNAILDANIMLDQIENSVVTGESQISFGEDFASIIVECKGYSAKLDFIGNNRFDIENDPETETGEYLHWKFYDTELESIEYSSLETGEIVSVDVAEFDDSFKHDAYSEPNFSESIENLLNAINCTDYIECENAPMQSSYDAGSFA